jgi:hypothetical protein
MDGFAIAPSAGEFGTLDLPFYDFRMVTHSDELTCRRHVFLE